MYYYPIIIVIFFLLHGSIRQCLNHYSYEISYSSTFTKQYNLYNVHIRVLSDMWTKCQHTHQAISFIRLCKIVTQWLLTSNYLPSNPLLVDQLQAWSQQKFNLLRKKPSQVNIYQDPYIYMRSFQCSGCFSRIRCLARGFDRTRCLLFQ